MHSLADKSAYDYGKALRRLKNNRSKVGYEPTKKYIAALSKICSGMPYASFDDDYRVIHTELLDDVNSNSLLSLFGPIHDGRIAKSVTKDGNCLFNSASLAMKG